MLYRRVTGLRLIGEEETFARSSGSVCVGAHPVYDAFSKRGMLNATEPSYDRRPPDSRL